MQNHAYSFTANTTDNVNRFNLIFSTTAGISENNATITNSIYSYGKDIFVDCSESNVKQIAIYNTIGQVVYTSVNADKTVVIRNLSLSIGIYYAVVKNLDGIKTEKLIIQ